ncbi:tripartite motif-containing protein 60-like [Acomys russatus]|uniref:tripartite motif-containing protein 60-like n=1 Tax=Acomys russatus TaxID=60746 RepID=UPI0021E20814|nr:tripartite motif-containing protein 60-like [Acomys russatus]
MDFLVLGNLHVICACPICLDFFLDPVTTPCGHNFCHACLSLWWNNVNDIFLCPVCKTCFPQRSFSRNSQLRDLSEAIRLQQETQSKRKQQEEQAPCQKHNQPLVLFCVKDLEVLCAQCSFSVEHGDHYACPIEKAAVYHRRVLNIITEILKIKVKESEAVVARQDRILLIWRMTFEYKKQQISYEFRQIKLFLQNELEALLNEIHIEELVGLSKLNEYVQALSDHISTLNDLLREAEANHVESDLTLLTTVPRAYHRLENLTCPKPLSSGAKQHGLSLPPQYSGLDKIIKQFQINVTFDVDTAHPQLVISEDRKSVVYKERGPSV